MNNPIVINTPQSVLNNPEDVTSEFYAIGCDVVYWNRNGKSQVRYIIRDRNSQMTFEYFETADLSTGKITKGETLRQVTQYPVVTAEYR